MRSKVAKRCRTSRLRAYGMGQVELPVESATQGENRASTKCFKVRNQIGVGLAKATELDRVPKLEKVFFQELERTEVRRTGAVRWWTKRDPTIGHGYCDTTGSRRTAKERYSFG